MRILLATLCLMTGASAAFAQPAQRPAHFVSQRAGQAALREGPSFQHKVLWVYRHKGYPFRVVARYDTWRRVQDNQGTQGWMNAALLSDDRTILVTGKGRVQIFQKEDGGKVVALADPGAVAELKRCSKTACRIAGKDIDGWIARDRVWGVEPNEVFD